MGRQTRSGGDGVVERSTAAYWDGLAQREGPIAAVLDPRDGRGLKNLYIDVLHKTALREVLDVTDTVLLDFGCGSGRFFPLTVGPAKCVVGLDVSQKMLAYARRWAQRGRCELVLFDGKSLPFAERCFDRVLSVWSMQYLTDEGDFQDMVSQIVACARTGGKIYLLEQARVGARAWQRTADEYRSAFGRRGCSCVQSYPVRNARSALLYAIRYGLVPRRWVSALAQGELRKTRRHRPAPWVPYQDYLFVFSKG